MRPILVLPILALCLAAPLPAQRIAAERAHERVFPAAPQSAAGRAAVHYGKWLTAAGTATLTLLAAREHRRSRRDWDALLTICRSADEACALGPDGRYVRPDAELLYQRSRFFDARANRRLFGAQISLLATAALFILDLRPGEGPENIPFAPLDVTVSPQGNGAHVGVQLRF